MVAELIVPEDPTEVYSVSPGDGALGLIEMSGMHSNKSVLNLSDIAYMDPKVVSYQILEGSHINYDLVPDEAR